MDTNEVIKDLSKCMIAAIEAGESVLARTINKKINQLIKHGTNIPE
jgi:hypothetical protein